MGEVLLLALSYRGVHRIELETPAALGRIWSQGPASLPSSPAAPPLGPLAPRVTRGSPGGSAARHPSEHPDLRARGALLLGPHCDGASQVTAGKAGRLGPLPRGDRAGGTFGGLWLGHPGDLAPPIGGSPGVWLQVRWGNCFLPQLWKETLHGLSPSCVWATPLPPPLALLGELRLTGPVLLGEASNGPEATAGSHGAGFGPRKRLPAGSDPFPCAAGDPTRRQWSWPCGPLEPWAGSLVSL